MIVALCCQAYVKTYILTTYFFLNQRKLKLQEQANKQESIKAKYMPVRLGYKGMYLLISIPSYLHLFTL